MSRRTILVARDARHTRRSRASRPQRTQRAADGQWLDATNHAAAMSLCVNYVENKWGCPRNIAYGITYAGHRLPQDIAYSNPQDIAYDARPRTGPRCQRQGKAPRGLRRSWATTAKLMIEEITRVAMEASMSGRADDLANDPRRGRDRVHPVQGSDDAAANYHQDLGYHIRDMMTAAIEGKDVFKHRGMGNVLEGATKYCETGEVNSKSIASLEGMMEHFTTAPPRPPKWAMPQMATPSWDKTASEEIR
jgi:hypothetical protein